VLVETLALTDSECQRRSERRGEHGNYREFGRPEPGFSGYVRLTMTDAESPGLLPDIYDVIDSPTGEQLIDAAAGLDPLSARAALSRQFPGIDPMVLRAAIEQAQLRVDASARMTNPAAVLWTRDGLEQASRSSVSRYRAARLRTIGVTVAVDLTCGLGLDMLAMAEVGITVIGVEQDSRTAALAVRNAVRHGLDVDVRIGSCTDEALLATLPRDAAWFIDPARRTHARRADGSHRRLGDPQLWSPPWSWVLELAAHVGSSAGPHLLVAKSSPAHDDFPDAGVEWVSEHEDLIEATAWWGAGTSGFRGAVLLNTNGEPITTIAASGVHAAVAGLPERGQWLFAPNPAVIRAGAVADLAHLIGAALVDEHLAYLTSDIATNHPAVLRQWEVLYSGPYDRGLMSALCVQEGITRVDITGRGRRFDPQRVRRELHLPGGPGRVATLHTLALGPQRRSAVVLGYPAVGGPGAD
jgi:hypothetical protein